MSPSESEGSDPEHLRQSEYVWIEVGHLDYSAVLTIDWEIGAMDSGHSMWKGQGVVVVVEY